MGTPRARRRHSRMTPRLIWIGDKRSRFRVLTWTSHPPGVRREKRWMRKTDVRGVWVGGVRSSTGGRLSDVRFGIIE